MRHLRRGASSDEWRTSFPCFYRRQQQIDDMQKVAKIILETGCSYEEAGGKLVNGADGQQLAADA